MTDFDALMTDTRTRREKIMGVLFVVAAIVLLCLFIASPILEPDYRSLKLLKTYEACIAHSECKLNAHEFKKYNELKRKYND